MYVCVCVYVRIGLPVLVDLGYERFTIKVRRLDAVARVGTNDGRREGQGNLNKAIEGWGRFKKGESITKKQFR